MKDPGPATSIGEAPFLGMQKNAARSYGDLCYQGEVVSSFRSRPFSEF